MTASVAKDGSFSIGGFQAGRSHDLIARAFSYTAIGRAEGVAAGTHDLVIQVDPGGTIRGTVLDSSGRPVGPGVSVRAGTSQEPYTARCGTVCPGESSSTTTGEDGTFLLEWLGDWTFTVIAMKGYAPALEAAIASWIPPGSTGVVLRLGTGPWENGLEGERRESSPHEPAATAITGWVVTREGTAPIEEFHLEASLDGSGERRRARVSPSGAFDTGALRPGTYTIRARTPWTTAGELAKVDAGARGVKVLLDPQGTIVGQVFDSAGRPVRKGVTVIAEAAEGARSNRPGSRTETFTREDGTFILQFLGDHEFTVWASPGWKPMGWTSTDVAGWNAKGLRPGVKGLSLRLEAPVTLAGTVLAADGTPCTSCTVRAVQPGRGGENVGGPQDSTDRKGSFTLGGLAAGKVKVTLKAEGKEHDLGEFEAPAEGLVLRIPGD